MSSFFAMNDFYIINPECMDFLLDWIYVKRPRSSCITLFLKKVSLFQPVFHWMILRKISKLLFQRKENEFSALEMLGVRITFKN